MLRLFNVGDAQLLPSPTTQSPIEIVESTEEILNSEKKELKEPDVIGKHSLYFILLYFSNFFTDKVINDEYLSEQSIAPIETIKNAELSESSYTIEEISS